MATYILTGGNDRVSSTYGERLLKVVRTQVSGPIRVLDCLFATPREDWEAKFASRTAWFKSMFGPDATVAFAFPDRFERQLTDADVLYIEGGDDALLQHYFGQVPDIASKFKGKVVVGSSAGANWLSSAYWRCDWRDAARGAGITNCNILVHYESGYGKDDPRGPIDWKRAVKELCDFAGSPAEITPIREGEFIVVEA